MRRWQSFRARWERRAPRIRDLVIIVLVLIETIVTVLTTTPGGTSDFEKQWAPDAVTLAVGLAMAAALWWRRRFPVALAIAGVLVYPATKMILPLLFGLYLLAYRRRDRWLLLASVVGFVGFLLVELWTDDDTFALITFVALIVGTPVGLGAYFGVRHDLLASLRERAERAEAERELRAEQARLSERARIAQEMHDVLAHKVSLIALHAGGLEVNPAMPAARVESSAGLIRETARQAMDDLREVLGVLRTDLSVDGADLAPVPSAADLERLIAASRSAGVAVSAQVDLPDDLPDTLGRTVYRVVQEALTNVHKHARGAATAVRVVGAVRDGVTVRVENIRPVAAGSLLPGAGAGLVGLRERVKLADGTMSAGPTPDGGWALEVWLPWPAGEEAV